jgi:hypothetical protein
VRPVLLLQLLSCVAAAVTSAAVQEFPYAEARRGCTQEDARALEIYLTQRPDAGGAEPAPPYLRIEISWSDWSVLLDRDFALSPLSRPPGDRPGPVVRAELNLSRGAPVWLRGALRLSRVEVDREVAGSYAFTQPDGNALTGGFTAPWRAGGSGCG